MGFTGMTGVMTSMAWQMLGILAQGEQGGGGTTGENSNVGPLGAFLGNNTFLFVGLGLVFWFLIIAPARKERKQHEELLSGLKKNDQVQTSAGILGRISGIDESTGVVTLKIDDNKDVRMKVLRSTITGIVSDKKDSKSK